MFDVSWSDYHDIFSKVIGSMEVNNHVSLDLIDVVNVSKDRLAHHMLSVDVVVDIFHEGLHHIFVCGFKFLPDGVLFHL